MAAGPSMSPSPPPETPPGDDGMPEVLARRGIAVAAAGFVVGLISVSIVSGVVAAATGQAIDAYGVQVAGLLGLWIGLLGVPILASRLWGSGDLGRDYGLRIVWRPDLKTGVIVGLLGQFVLVPVVVGIFKAIDPNLKLSEASVDLAKRSHGGGFVMLAVLVGLAAPVVEEIYFRGVLQGSLLYRLPVWPAVGLAGAFFGLVHFDGKGAGAAALVVSLAAFGWALGALVVRARRLGPAIVAHVVFNVIATIELLVTTIHGK